jgi:hypothetical protein
MPVLRGFAGIELNRGFLHFRHWSSKAIIDRRKASDLILAWTKAARSSGGTPARAA